MDAFEKITVLSKVKKEMSDLAIESFIKGCNYTLAKLNEKLKNPKFRSETNDMDMWYNNFVKELQKDVNDIKKC